MVCICFSSWLSGFMHPSTGYISLLPAFRNLRRQISAVLPKSNIHTSVCLQQLHLCQIARLPELERRAPEWSLIEGTSWRAFIELIRQLSSYQALAYSQVSSTQFSQETLVLHTSSPFGDGFQSYAAEQACTGLQPGGGGAVGQPPSGAKGHFFADI